MRKIVIIIVVLSAFSISVKAQYNITYRAFKFDIDFSVFNKLTLTFEPHYRLSDRFTIGLRYQNAIDTPHVYYSDFTVAQSSTYSNTTSYKSFCLSGDYYLNIGKTKGSILVFAGGGAGIFSRSVDVATTIYKLPFDIFGTTTHNITNITSAGFFQRLGLEINHFRTSFEYNITGSGYNYYSVNVGFFFGGGKKKIEKK
jgi:hypothetical protein